VVERFSHALQAPRGEDLEVEEPVSGWDFSSFDFHPTLPGVLGAALIWHEVVQMGESSQKRLLPPVRMMEALHHEQLPLHGVMRLIPQGAGDGHLRVCEHRIPAGFLLVKPAPHPLAIGRLRCVGDVIDTVTSPLAERKHAQPFALSHSVQ
jgi:hypothetical protein